MPSRIAADGEDRCKLRNKLALCLDFWQPTQLPNELINIVTGKVAPCSINLDQSVSIGKQQVQQFVSSWPEGFHRPIEKKVLTMTASHKQTKIGKKPILDTSFIYSRILCLQSTRDIDMKITMRHELSPVPTALFEDTGDLRYASQRQH